MRTDAVKAARLVPYPARIPKLVANMLIPLACGLQAAGAAHAEDQQVNNGTDPTKLTRKFIATYEHVDLSGGGGKDVLKFNYKMSLSNDLSLDLKLPVSRVAGLGGNERFDLGDASVAFSHVFGLSKESGNVLIGELSFDTAARPELGAGRTVFKGSYIRAFFLTGGSIFAPAAVQEISIGGNTSRADVNKTTFDFYYVPKLSDPQNLVTFDPSIVFDWESNKQYGALAVTFGRVFGKAFGGNSVLTVKPSAFAGAERPGNWGLELGWKLIGF